MSPAPRGSAQPRAIAPWIRAVVYGSGLGLLNALGQRSGAWSALAAAGAWLTHVAGPFWVPMLAGALRVVWLWVRALRTRSGRGARARPVQAELEKLAPIFSIFGLAATLWGLDVALGVLDRDAFLARLPELMSGLGVASVSTLVGVGLQIATLLIAAYAPAWSLARVTRSGERELYRLDGALLGEDEHGLSALLDAIEARQPEALHLDLDPLLPAERSAALRARICRSIDGPTETRPSLPGIISI